MNWRCCRSSQASLPARRALRREWAEWTANTLIFFLSGAIIAAETYEASPSVLRPVDWAWSVLLWLLLIAIRASVALLFFPVLSRVG
jgi:hypothetical protein